MTTLAVLTVIAVAFVVLFDYTNGFHDASNIIATVIASRAMTPIQAVIIVATFEFLGPILGGTAVANTIGKFVDVGDLDATKAMVVIFCGIIGAITWNLGTWWFGIPSSSSHALVGGLIGSVILAAGPDHVKWGFSELVQHAHVTGVMKVLLGLVISPVIGFWVGFGIHRLMSRLLRGARPGANRVLRRAQWLTSAGLAFSHGANDAQKSMGIITLVLVLGGHLTEFDVPFWVILSCAGAITLGILSGGWRIVRTVGFGIYKVRPLHALDAQLTSAAVILSASYLGAPVSTTHVVSSSIMGIGSSERPKAVRWAKAFEIVSTWLITIPGSATVAIVAYLIASLFI
ncbi:MAG: inorganic phosphate transporter [Kineosporiaceae bacterium]|nr:inorganic phosphate transporter [Kineosporiaceae bacterium]MBK8075996.1 inorganic phosphate transporter [Kineosporiaceae bacterium]